MKQLIKFFRYYRYRKFYVVLDGRVNSITISKALYKHITRRERSNNDIFVFDANDSKQFAFAMRDDFAALRNAKTVFCQLQYNDVYNKIGFRSEHPSVTAILSSYGCPVDHMVRLSVIPRNTRHGSTFYEIQRPVNTPNI
jgi:hypothetical protein